MIGPQAEEQGQHDQQVKDRDQAANVGPGTAQRGQVAQKARARSSRSAPVAGRSGEPLRHLIRRALDVVDGGGLLLVNLEPQVIQFGALSRSMIACSAGGVSWLCRGSGRSCHRSVRDTWLVIWSMSSGGVVPSIGVAAAGPPPGPRAAPGPRCRSRPVPGQPRRRVRAGPRAGRPLLGWLAWPRPGRLRAAGCRVWGPRLGEGVRRGLRALFGAGLGARPGCATPNPGSGMRGWREPGQPRVAPYPGRRLRRPAESGTRSAACSGRVPHRMGCRPDPASMGCSGPIPHRPGDRSRQYPHRQSRGNVHAIRLGRLITASEYAPSIASVASRKGPSRGTSPGSASRRGAHGRRQRQ